MHLTLGSWSFFTWHLWLPHRPVARQWGFGRHHVPEVHRSWWVNLGRWRLVACRQA